MVEAYHQYLKMVACNRVEVRACHNGFFMGLPRTQRGNDAIWVVVDRLTKSTHFVPMRTSDSVDYLAELYIRDIMRLHEVPITIVSDRDPRFTTRLWQSLQNALGTILTFSTTYHP